MVVVVVVVVVGVGVGVEYRVDWWAGGWLAVCVANDNFTERGRETGRASSLPVPEISIKLYVYTRL